MAETSASDVTAATTTEDCVGIAYLSATEALTAFRAREVSPVELMQAVIDRTAQMEPRIGAFAEQTFDEALAQATEAERRYLVGEARALEGLPVAAKELHAMAGRALRSGSLTTEGNVAAENAPVIDRVLDAGGIIHARTTQPEFGVVTYTHSRLWGVTRNPWNVDYTPGGSSGGAGAALAAGTTTLATGSDIGGSIRIPAAFTGTVGFRPPHGRVPAASPGCADGYRSDGPMARTVDDCVLFANALVGPDPRDHYSLRPKLEIPSDHPGVDGMRIALCVQLGDYQVHPEVETATRATATCLAEAGAVVEEITLPWTRARLRRAIGAHFATIFGAGVREIVRDHPDQVCSYTLDYAAQIEMASKMTTFLEGLTIETAIQRELGEAMTGFDALVCPTTAIPVFPAGDDMRDGCIFEGRNYGPPLDLVMTLPFNVAGNCPILNVPSGRSMCGVPMGVQIVGHPFDDATVFRVGKAVEQHRPWDYDLST